MSASTHIAPRATLIRYAVGFIMANCSRPSSPCVSEVSGATSTRKSDSRGQDIQARRTEDLLEVGLRHRGALGADHPHPECNSPPGDLLPDRARPHNPDGLPADLSLLDGLPAVRGLRLQVVPEVLRHQEHVPDHELAHGDVQRVPERVTSRPRSASSGTIGQSNRPCSVNPFQLGRISKRPEERAFPHRAAENDLSIPTFWGYAAFNIEVDERDIWKGSTEIGELVGGVDMRHQDGQHAGIHLVGLNNDRAARTKHARLPVR